MLRVLPKASICFAKACTGFLKKTYMFSEKHPNAFWKRRTCFFRLENNNPLSDRNVPRMAG